MDGDGTLCGLYLEDNIKGVTPLKAAVEENNPDLVKLLIEKGAEVDHVTRGGTTRLQDAARLGFTGIMELLVVQVRRAGGAP